jgi:hypothetical protein
MPLPGGLPDAAFFAAYDARNLVGSVGADVTTWPDETTNGRDLVEDATQDAPTITETYFGGTRAVLFNNDTLEYDAGSEFHTGDIGFVFVARFIAFLDTSDVIMSAATGGSGSAWKHVFGYFAGGGGNYVIMSGDGSSGAHKLGGTPNTTDPFVARYVVRGAGNEELWINGTKVIDENSGANNLRGWRLGQRESDDRPCHAAIGGQWIVDLDTATEADLANVDAEVGYWFGIDGYPPVSFGTQPSLIPILARIIA